MCSPRSFPGCPGLDSLTGGAPVPPFWGPEPLPLPVPSPRTAAPSPSPRFCAAQPYPCPFLGLPLSRDCAHPRGSLVSQLPFSPWALPASGALFLCGCPHPGDPHPSSTTVPQSTSFSGIPRRPPFPSIPVLEIPEPAVQHAGNQPCPSPPPGPLQPLPWG